MTRGLTRHPSRRKAIDHAMWLTFEHRMDNIHYGVIESIEGDHLVVPVEHITFKGEKFEELPSDHSEMTYDHIQRIRMAYEPLPHWEVIAGMLSITDGEVLRFILAYRVPLERFIRYELAGRGHDENHQWVGFEQAAKMWLT